jgi:MFS family permease
MPEHGPQGSPSLRKRHIAAVMIGGIVEYYDFVVFTFFALQIGRAYFPASSEFASLMLSLATFGIGFAMRPLGGMILGAYADRAGRRAAMTLTLILMGVSIVALALIPPYAAIGIAAPILAVIARLVQGFALGGEIAPAIACILEGSPERRRGLFVSFFGLFAGAGALLGALVGLLLSWILSPAMLEADGWRIAFLLGALTLPLGVWLRRSLPETLPESAATAPHQGGWAIFREHRRAILLFFVIMAVGNIGFYIFQYATTYAQNVLHMSPRVAFTSTVSLNAVGIVATLLGGWLADTVGRKPVFVVSRIAVAVAAVPVFLWIVTDRTPTALIVGVTLLAALSQLGTGANWIWFAELLPAGVRGRAYGTTYGLAVALFGGTAQMVVAWLIQTTGSDLAPAWYLAAAYLLATIAGLMLPESAPARLGKETPAIGPSEVPA